MLKAVHIIPPLVALILAGAWNAAQMRSISSMEKDGGMLREKIAATLAAGDVPVDPSRAAHSGRNAVADSKDPIDWRQLSGLMQEMQNGGGMSNIRAIMSFQQRVMTMSKEEMIAALDDISKLGLSSDARQALEAMLISPLIGKDPRLALEHYAGRIQTDPSGVGWQLATALRAWAKQDLTAAAAWFDQQIAGGAFDSKTLDGKSEVRSQFEAALMDSLISTDLAAANRRLSDLPEDQRREILEQISFPELSPEAQKAYAEMVRQLVPADEREGSFAHIASQLVDAEGYGKVSTFLDAVNASPEERAAAAKQTAESQLEQLGSEGTVTRANVDQLREWLTRQAPGEVDRITGKALAEAAQEQGTFNYSAASQLVLQYQQSSGSDEVLIAFLEGYSAHSNLEEAKHLADMIADEKRRDEILQQLR